MWEPQGFYSPFLLRQPIVLFGESASRGLFNLPGSRMAVVYGSGFTEADRIQFAKGLKADEVKFIRKSWKGEPEADELSGTVAELEQFRPDVIVAAGGGSVIDGVKVARLLYEFPFIDVTKPRFGFLEWKSTFIAVPTTVGSGAEASSAAVLIDRKNGCKTMIVNHALQPSIVLLSPQYVRRSPLPLVLASALDAMSHIIEGYVSVVNNGLADILAEKGLQIFKEELSEADCRDIDFQHLQYAGYLGGIVQNHCIVGAAHGIAHQLSVYGYSHSEAIALLLPAVIRLNSGYEGAESRYRQLAVKSGFATVEALVGFILALRDRAGLGGRLEALKAQLQALVEDDVFVEHVLSDMGGKGNPIPLSKEYIHNLIQIL